MAGKGYFRRRYNGEKFRSEYDRIFRAAHKPWKTLRLWAFREDRGKQANETNP